MTIEFGEINWLAVAVAAVGAFFLGGLWYTALFGKAWQKAHHLTEEQLRKQQDVRPMPVFLAMQFVCYAFVSVGIALLINGAGVTGAGGGAMLGVCVWIVVAAAVLTNHLPTLTDWSGYFIDASFAAVYCIGIGALLGAWQ